MTIDFDNRIIIEGIEGKKKLKKHEKLYYCKTLEYIVKYFSWSDKWSWIVFEEIK